MSIWLRFGDRSIRWDGDGLPGGPPVLVPPAWALVERIWETIDAPLARALIEPSSWLDETVANLPMESGPLRLCLVVPDTTRAGAFLTLIPPLLSRLGVMPFAERTLLIATGTHRATSIEAIHRHLSGTESVRSDSYRSVWAPGAEDGELSIDWSRWSLIQNSEEGFRTHREVGRTAAGTPVRLHPAFLDADVRIVLGEATYHYFAGYGGASKMIFPGLAEPEGAMRNHRLALHGPGPGETAGVTQRRHGSTGDSVAWNEACAPGRIEDNPVAQDISGAAMLAPESWIIIADEAPPPNPDPASPRSYPVRVLQGMIKSGGAEPIDPVIRARQSLDARGKLVFTRAPDLLVADAGGAPRDATFLQAHKSLQHAVRFVPPGGSVLWIARCQEGFGSAQLEDLAAGRAEGGSSLDPGSTGLHLQTICALRRAVGRVQVALWSELPSEQVRRLGIEPLEEEAEARAWLAGVAGRRFWGWLPRAERFVPASGWRGGDLQ